MRLSLLLSFWGSLLLLGAPAARAQTGSITGTIFDDPNYGGGAGRAQLGTLGTAAVGTAATVELYTSTGAYVRSTQTSTTTATLGQYSFGSLTAGGYIVRVVNSTVRSTRPGSVAGLLPVQTFRTNGGVADANRVGGESPELQDAGAYVAGVSPVTFTFSSRNTTGDNTIFLDNLTLTDNGVIPNNSFETPSVGTGGGAYQYNPGGGNWTFSGYSGITYASAIGNSNFSPPAAPAGSQVAFLQGYGGNNGVIQQTVPLSTGITYTLSVRAAQRANSGSQVVQGTVTINGITTTLAFSSANGVLSGGNIAPLVAQGFATYTATFTVASTTNVLGLMTAQSQAPVTVGAVPVLGIDFGYNFSTIVNTNDNGQGSLRQFITNANTLTNANLAQANQLAGREVSIFMIPDGSAHNGQRANLVVGVTGSTGAARALIQLSTVLPAITDARTRIDGTTQTANIGNSNTGQVGTGGTVGAAAVALAQIERPEVELVANTSLGYSIDLEGDSLGVRGLAIHGGVVQAGTTTAARNLQIIGNLIGVTALSVSDPAGTTYNPTYGVYIRGASYGLVRGNLIGYAGSSGLNYSGGENTAGLLITRNEFVQNGYRQTGGDAMSFGDQANAGPATITYNLITTSNSDGVQFEIGQTGVGGINVVRNNTFFDNGNGSTSLSRAQLEGAAILYLQRNGGRTGTNADSIVFNRIYQTQASGIVVGYGQRNVIISRNSTFGNGTSRNSSTGGNLGIDLISRSNYYVSASNLLGNGLGAADYGNGDGVTPNTGTRTNVFGNGGMNYPVFTLTRYNTTNSITVTGFVGNAAGQTAFGGASIEIYFANSLDNNNDGPTIANDGLNVPHGEGQTYLTTITADANGNFSATIVAPAGVTFSTNGQSLTATAYLAGYGTSEFATNSALAAVTVGGYVFEDANYGGGAGRSRGTLGSGAVGRPGATVEIYNSGNAIVGTTTTDTNGQYSFNVASGNYTVRTVVPTVKSARPNGTTANPTPVAVQTYVRNDVNRVGGENLTATVDGSAAATVGVTLSFVGQNPSGLDNTAFIDNVEVLKSGVPLTLNPVGNNGFENPYVDAYLFNPSGVSWSFAATQAGIAGSSQTTNGTQAGFIQGDGAYIQQTVQLPAGVYSVRFITSQRIVSGRVNNQTIIVRLNGVEIGQITPASNTYAAFTTSEFSVSGSSQTSVPGLSQVPIVVGTTSITDVDFGYNFDVITNTNDAGQGSLRQFIANSNALGGEGSLAQVYTNASNVTTALAASKESSIFMVPGPAAVAGLRSSLANQLNTNGVAVFTPATATSGALVITDANTILDGTTQSRNSNTNNTDLGTGGLVGTAATALARLNGPEVQIVGTPGAAGSDFGVTLSGTGDGVQGISIYGFGNTGATSAGNASGANIYVTGGATTGTVISGNVIGTVATAFPTNGTDPNTATTRSTGNGILLASLNTSTVDASITNNLIGYNGTSGVQNLAGGATGGVVISGNEIRNNALLNLAADGVRLGTAGGTVQANLITGNKGSGVDFEGSAGNILVTGNTIGSNGAGGAETSGVRAWGQGNAITLNTIASNTGSGVLVRNGTNTANVAGATTITRNSIASNGKLGIDLLNTGDSETSGNVTFNDMGDVDGRKNGSSAIGGNGMLNFPVLVEARINNGNLLLTGYARPGATIEVFVAGSLANASGFGEGSSFLFSALEGNTNTANGPIDKNSQAGTYVGPINGRSQGTDNTNMFSFSVPLPAGVAANSIVSATATLAMGTSEFSGVITVTNGPLPVELVSFTVKAVSSDAQLTWATASEKNNDHFDIERSLNGTDFTRIAVVAGHGTTTARTDYALTDTGIGAKLNGSVYYRLQQVDIDGKTAYSPVQAVKFASTRAAAPTIGLAPNPAATSSTLDLSKLPAGSYAVGILDGLGRTISTAYLAGGQLHNIDLLPLATGSYLLRVSGTATDGTTVNLVQRLIKE